MCLSLSSCSSSPHHLLVIDDDPCVAGAAFLSLSLSLFDDDALSPTITLLTERASEGDGNPVNEGRKEGSRERERH